MRQPVLIAGGGIGGLTLAALLQRRGLPFLVLERASRFDPLGAGLILQPNAVKALRIGGIDQPVLSRGSAMEVLQIRNANGRVLSSLAGARFRAAFEAGAFGFHRATLHAALLDLVPQASIRLSAGLSAFENSDEGVVALLETGERIEGSALVGADGINSAVRRQRLGDGEPRYSGYTSFRGVTERGSLWPAGQMSESWGRGARFGLVAIDAERLYWFATANGPAGDDDTSKARLRQRFAEWHDPIEAVIEATPDEAILRTDIADREPVTGWSENRVTLLGDAAHPMTPDLGQGGGQAIEDAVVLDLCLSASSDPATAFRDYEARRLGRTARVVKEARRFGRLGQMESPVALALRDLAVRGIPSFMTLRSLRWLYDFDV